MSENFTAYSVRCRGEWAVTAGTTLHLGLDRLIALPFNDRDVSVDWQVGEFFS